MHLIQNEICNQYNNSDPLLRTQDFTVLVQQGPGPGSVLVKNAQTIPELLCFLLVLLKRKHRHSLIS